MSYEEAREKASYHRKDGMFIRGSLEFHHIDPETKLFDVSIGIAHFKQITLQQLLEEVDKCILLCKRCHLKLHREIKRRIELLSKNQGI
jgi:hypothetical protein